MRATFFARAGGRQGKSHRVGAVPGGGGRIAVPGSGPASWLPLLALAACAGTASPPASNSPPGADPSPEPAGVVAAFLDAANRRDHAVMASHFGTAAGPIGNRGGTLGCAFRKVFSWMGLGDRCLTAQEVELRMDLLAAILAHESYRVADQTTVAGRDRPATRVEVEMDTRTKRGARVPFVLVQTDEGTWLVEEVDLERLTGMTSRPVGNLANHARRCPRPADPLCA
ncbi:MAG: hypothetical protein F4106_08900, partial [Gemmatimonadetes bacterium]|nr:hypothetical protein [Gemmatimonadota bacterium]